MLFHGPKVCVEEQCSIYITGVLVLITLLLNTLESWKSHLQKTSIFPQPCFYQLYQNYAKCMFIITQMMSSAQCFPFFSLSSTSQPHCTCHQNVHEVQNVSLSNIRITSSITLSPSHMKVTEMKSLQKYSFLQLLNFTFCPQQTILC